MKRLVLVSLFTALAGPALAQGATPSIAELNAAVRPGFQTPAPLPTGKTYQQITMLKTAVEHRFGPEGLTGSVGLLCGLQQSRDDRGAAQALGGDADGKFVGAKLSRAF